ncbi:MAG: POTRA domain-containing protein [Bacteroidota bacterium]|nr:POTRA domain-containing protein [Bacteroidota bacterium]
MKTPIFTLLFLVFSILSHAQNTITIADITINGNKITKENILLREIVFTKNSSFPIIDLEQKILKSKQNLINLKLFNFVEITYVLDGHQVKIIIDVIERWYFWPYPVFEISERNFNSWWDEFTASNYSDFSRLNYGLFLNWENFRGRNELIQLKIRKGFKEHYLCSYQIPYFNKRKTIGINTNLQLFRRKKSFYKTENNILLYHTNNNTFTTKDYEFNTELLYRKGVQKSHNLRWHYFFSDVDPIIINKNPNYLNNGSNYSGSYTKLTYQFENENRDYIEYPLHGHYLKFESSKYFKVTSPVKHIEIIAKAEKHIEIKHRLFLGSSFKGKWSSSGYQPYFAQEGFGFDDYVRGYEYYVIDGQDFWLSKTILKYAIVEKTKFDIPYVKMKQFKKAHYSLYLGFFSDLGYVIDTQTNQENALSNSLLWGNGISLDYVTYYDKLLRIEFAINHLGEKGVFLHFSNPFGEKKKL